MEKPMQFVQKNWVKIVVGIVVLWLLYQLITGKGIFKNNQNDEGHEKTKDVKVDGETITLSTVDKDYIRRIYEQFTSWSIGATASSEGRCTICSELMQLDDTRLRAICKAYYADYGTTVYQALDGLWNGDPCPLIFYNNNPSQTPYYKLLNKVKTFND